MPVPKQVRKQVEEADAILAQLNTKPGEAPAAPEPPPPAEPAAAAPDNNKKPDQPDVPPGTSNPPPVLQTPPAEDFEQKYRVLQGKYDSEILTKNRTIQLLNERVGVLEQLVETMKRNPPPPPAPPAPTADDRKSGKRYIKPEDEEEYGKDMIDFAQRAARDAVAPELDKLRAENEQLKADLGKNTQQTARERMLIALDRDVPDWQTVNVDDKFLAWLGEVEVFSGQQRQKSLEEAYNANDATRLIAIFKAFKREDSATGQLPATPARTPALSKETLVAPGTPKGAPSAEAPGDNKKVWTQKEISDYYAHKRRGGVSPEEAVKTERDIALAAREGRVTL